MPRPSARRLSRAAVPPVPSRPLLFLFLSRRNCFYAPPFRFPVRLLRLLRLPRNFRQGKKKSRCGKYKRAPEKRRCAGVMTSSEQERRHLPSFHGVGSCIHRFKSGREVRAREEIPRDVIRKRAENRAGEISPEKNLSLPLWPGIHSDTFPPLPLPFPVSIP